MDASGATTYPVKIDPFDQQGPALTGSGASGDARFGASVALSGNGTTALVGGWKDASEAGAAWVFTRSGESWTQQGPKLTGSGEAGAGRFGSSVALSEDGNTALVGGPRDASEAGAAWVFTRSGESWTQQGSKLTGSEAVGAARFGIGVALSDRWQHRRDRRQPRQLRQGRRVGVHARSRRVDPTGREAHRDGRGR